MDHRVSPSRTVHTGPTGADGGAVVVGVSLVCCWASSTWAAVTATAVAAACGSGGSGAAALAVPVTPSRALPASTAPINDDAAACGTRRPGIRSVQVRPVILPLSL